MSLLGILVAAATLTATPASDGGPRKLLWGPPTLPNGQSAFPTYRRLGVDVLQVQLPWRETARARPADPRSPTDPAYVWPDRVTQSVDGARRAGIAVMLLVKQTPDWANGGRGAAQAPDADADYADFMVAASRRYPSVRHWMIWGEPQRGDAFTPMPANSPVGPRRYATLLDTAYAALKRQSRANKVIGGNTWSLGPVTPDQFVKWMTLPNGKPPRLDFYGHNPFSVRYPELRKRPYFAGLRDLSDVDTLAGEIDRAYRPRRQRPRLWLSEFTVASAPNDTFRFSVSRSEQARWLSGAFRLARRYRRVEGLGWFQLVDTSTLAVGLLDAEGRPKPAFDAYRRAR